MEVEVEILGQVITGQYGILNTGDILRTSAEFAKHLVEDCSAAKYANSAPKQEVVAAEQAEVAQPKPPAKKKK